MDLTTAAYYPMGNKRGSLSFLYGDLTGVGNNGLHPAAASGYGPANAGLSQQIHPAAALPINLNMGIPMGSAAGGLLTGNQDEYDMLMTDDIMDFDADQLAAKRKFSLGFSLANSAGRRGSNCSWLNMGAAAAAATGGGVGVNLTGAELRQNKRGSLGITLADLNDLTQDDDTATTNSAATGLINKRSSMDMLFNNKRMSMDMNLGMAFNNKRASMDMLLNNLNKRSSMDMLYNNLSSGMGMNIGMGGMNKRSTMDMLLNAPLPASFGTGTEADNLQNQTYQGRASIGGPGHTFHFIANPGQGGRKHSLAFTPIVDPNANDDQKITNTITQPSHPESSSSHDVDGKRSETSSNPTLLSEQEQEPAPEKMISGDTMATTTAAADSDDSSKKPCPLNPLSPSYSEEFVTRYQMYLRSLIHLMDKSESSRKQVRKLKMTLKKSMNDQQNIGTSTSTTSASSSTTANPNSTSTSNNTYSANPRVSFAAIKSSRRKKSKKKGSLDSGSSGSTSRTGSITSTDMGSLSSEATATANNTNENMNVNMNSANQSHPAIYPQLAADGSRRRSSMMVSSFKMQFFPDSNF